MTQEYVINGSLTFEREIHFPKGTPIYQIHYKDVPIGGRASLNSYFKTGKTLNETFSCPEFPKYINYVIPYKNLGYLMHKDSIEAQESRRKKTIIIFSLIAAAIICMIIYKHKHK